MLMPFFIVLLCGKSCSLVTTIKSNRIQAKTTGVTCPLQTLKACDNSALTKSRDFAMRLYLTHLRLETITVKRDGYIKQRGHEALVHKVHNSAPVRD
jgi:hypothetical protein